MECCPEQGFRKWSAKAKSLVETFANRCGPAFQQLKKPAEPTNFLQAIPPTWNSLMRRVQFLDGGKTIDSTSGSLAPDRSSGRAADPEGRSVNGREF